VATAGGRESVMQSLVRGVSGASVQPYFEELPSPPPAGAGLNAAAAQAPVFASYVVIAPANADPVALAKTLNERDDVEIAYVEGGPTAPPVNPANNPLYVNQNYLRAAPIGIDAFWTWDHADGSGVNFVDLERGWTLNHEDLASATIGIISGLNQDFTGHGTAVLGEVVGFDNMLGVVGIAPSARARVVSQWRTANNYQTADAVRSAISVMRAGDVLLLEAQTTYPPGNVYLPVEVEQAVYDAIRAATEAGIVVVEAGGNGPAVDLDNFQDINGRQILNRSSHDFRDSGAIMVGAASSSCPHARLGFSNFGSRIDCYAWGENVQTTGDGWTGNEINSYTPLFGGTSGASPIVTGAAILLQSWARARGELYMPHLLRRRLSDPAINTASVNPLVDRIGVMPNLRAIITQDAGLLRPEQEEIARLKREVAKLNAERDILKKSAAYFAKEST
jgi:hypothetical protein